MKDAYARSDSLIIKLQTNGTVVKTSKDFIILTNDNSQKIQFSENLLKEYELLPNYDEFKLRKCNKKAEEFKNLGNQLYRNKKFYEALVSYNKSLCYSPEDSKNVGIGFANRSAVYFEMRQYEKCIENIELAKNYNYPKDKIDKLNKREEQAIEKFNNFPDSKQKMMKYEAARERFLEPKLKGKENFDIFAADCLEVKTSPEFGRHLITNEDLKVGSVIVIEKPFSKIIVPKAIYEACANCLKKNLMNLLPCFNCCSAMFCSEDCRSAAQEKFHKYECGLVNVIDELFSKPFRCALRTFFEALHICGTPSKLREFLNSIKDSNATILDFNYTDEATFRKNSLHSIDTLVTVEKSQHCSVSDLFQRSNVCAFISNLMLNHSEPLKALLVAGADQDFFREFIFKYSQIAAMSGHGIECNAFDFIEKVQLGSAFYPFCSLINHSCASNVVRMSFETNNYIVVNRPIKKGEQIFDNYGFHHCLESLEERQRGLLEQYRFECQCEACKNDYPLYYSLNVKNRKLLETLQKDYEYLAMQNFDKAVENFEKYCKLIDKLDKNYPSHEISKLQEMILFCLTMFSKSESYEA